MGNLKVKRLSVLMLLLLISSVATAEITVGEFREAKARGGVKWSGIELYVNGVGTGFATANVALESEHKPPLYCQPDKLTLESNNYIEMLEQQIAERKAADKVSINIVLLFALKATFPCPKAGESHEH
jgi:hypothetical protein